MLECSARSASVLRLHLQGIPASLRKPGRVRGRPNPPRSYSFDAGARDRNNAARGRAQRTSPLEDLWPFQVPADALTLTLYPPSQAGEGSEADAEGQALAGRQHRGAEACRCGRASRGRIAWRGSARRGRRSARRGGRRTGTRCRAARCRPGAGCRPPSRGSRVALLVGVDEARGRTGRAPPAWAGRRAAGADVNAGARARSRRGGSSRAPTSACCSRQLDGVELAVGRHARAATRRPSSRPAFRPRRPRRAPAARASTSRCRPSSAATWMSGSPAAALRSRISASTSSSGA